MSCPNCKGLITAEALPGVESVCSTCTLPIVFAPPGEWVARSWDCWGCREHYAAGWSVVQIVRVTGERVDRVLGRVLPGEGGALLFICADCDQLANATIEAEGLERGGFN